MLSYEEMLALYTKMRDGKENAEDILKLGVSLSMDQASENEMLERLKADYANRNK